MATKVNFHSLSESAYEAATKADGGLYFISDNGEIRRGSQHVTGTRVYTAVDSSGTTAVDSLDIEFNGTSISSQDFPIDDLPKKGDMLVVEHVLTTISETHWEKDGVEVPEGTDGAEEVETTTPDKVEYTAYIYATNGGTYSSAGWQACDGNVDASKVILTSDIMMAGDYKNVGNKDKGSTTASQNWETSGKSVAEALQEIFTKKLQPTVTSPAVTLTLTNASQSLEVGTTSSVPTFSASLSAGSYTYGPATGVAAQSWSVSDGTNTYTTSSGNLPTIKASDASQSYTVTATATHNAGATPKDNLGGTATVAGIASGEKSASKTVTVTGYRKWFYLVDTDGTGTIDSALIRSGVNGGNCESATEKQFTTGAGAVRIIVAIPKKTSGTASIDGAKTLTNVILVSASNTPILEYYVKQSGTVNVNDAAGENPIPYEIWIYKPASISPTEVHKLVIG